MDSAPRSAERRTYGQILKSTSLIGGSSVVSIAFSIVRSKAVAMFLGPAGVGLMSLYNSVADLTQSVSTLGIPSSGVRQIAEAVGSDDDERIAHTVTVLRRISVFLGLLGAAILVFCAGPIAEFTFGDRRQVAGVALLAVAVLFRSVSAGQTALIQGMRRIADLARMTILAAFLSTAVSVPMIYFLLEEGVVPSLVATAVVSLLTSWWYSRKVSVRTRSMSLSQMWPEAAMLLRLGIAFMMSGLLTLGSAYAIRIILLRQAGFEAAGLYQAAWTLGGMYTGLILQAMGTDFYPRLTGVASDNHECNRLVNEQAQVSLLLAGPGVVATLTFAPLILTIFYSANFQDAANLVRWLCLGMMLRVIAWPMGFIVLAKGASKIFFWTEVAATVIHVGLAWLLIGRFGIDGAGGAFFALYVWHSVLIYAVVRHLSGFRWSPENQRLGIFFLPLIGLVFGSFLALPFWLAISIGCAAVILASVYSLHFLLQLLPADLLPARIRPLVGLWIGRSSA